MNLYKKNSWIAANAKVALTIIPVVVIMIIIFLSLTKNKIVNLSKDKMALNSLNCSEEINKWSAQTLDELNIYKNIIEHTSHDDQTTLKILETSCGINAAFPYGLYLGDENGTYLDGSGWVPDDDFVVTERDWYKEGLTHNEFTFGEPYLDAMTDTVCVSATTKLNYKPVRCILSADIYLDHASKILTSITHDNIDNAFCVSENNHVIIASSETDMLNETLNDHDPTENSVYSNVNILLDQGFTGQKKIETAYGKYYIDIIKLETSDWYLVTCSSWTDMLYDMMQLELIMIAIALVASAILIFMTIKISKEMSFIKTKASTDPLTGLLNRSGFKEIVKDAIKDNPNTGMLVIIDMDNFKLINDQLGHLEGDIVLKLFANVLKSYFNRNMDIVTRMGGDEFAIFVGRDIAEEEAKAMLKKFIAIFHKNFDMEYPDQNLSISMGAAFLMDAGEYDNMLRLADIALYHVKNNGKNGFKICDTEIIESEGEM